MIFKKLNSIKHILAQLNILRGFTIYGNNKHNWNVHFLKKMCVITASCCFCSNIIFVVEPPMGEIASDCIDLLSAPVCTAFPNMVAIG